MGRISTSYRYMIDIIGTDPFSLGELWVVNLEKLEKLSFETCVPSKYLISLRSGHPFLS